MSSGLDTATRRQIRKAFGPEALKVIEAHEQGLRAHAETLAGLARGIGEERKDRITVGGAIQTFANSAHQRCDAHDHLLKDHARALTEVREDFYCRSLFGRLRWLLRGK